MGSCGCGPAALFCAPGSEQGELEQQAGAEDEREEEALLRAREGAWPAMGAGRAHPTLTSRPGPRATAREGPWVAESASVLPSI